MEEFNNIHEAGKHISPEEEVNTQVYYFSHAARKRGKSKAATMIPLSWEASEFVNFLGIEEFKSGQYQVTPAVAQTFLVYYVLPRGACNQEGHRSGSITRSAYLSAIDAVKWLHALEAGYRGVPVNDDLCGRAGEELLKSFPDDPDAPCDRLAMAGSWQDPFVEHPTFPPRSPNHTTTRNLRWCVQLPNQAAAEEEGTQKEDEEEEVERQEEEEERQEERPEEQQNVRGKFGAGGVEELFAQCKTVDESEALVRLLARLVDSKDAQLKAKEEELEAARRDAVRLSSANLVMEYQLSMADLSRRDPAMGRRAVSKDESAAASASRRLGEDTDEFKVRRVYSWNVQQ